MRNKKIKSFALLLGIGLSGLQAQNAATASGGDASGTGGSLSYSIGQAVYTTAVGSSGSVAQGVQQPYEISVLTSIEHGQEIDLQLSTYPNPTTDFLNLRTGNLRVSGISYRLSDINGKLFKSGKAEGSETKILMADLRDAVYLLEVMENNKEVKTFKIIKN
ncbi:MAG: Protein of unknown function precursor [Bacteroidota bacterium]|jgi:hypothetical protein|nr:Protein of unknown function precursor [Bacteroidota bacterium]